MGYMLAMGFCYACKNLFSFNPDSVPSILIDGEREPLCMPCINKINARRAEKGHPPFIPLPDAYKPGEC